jgi:hypothetical protein
MEIEELQTQEEWRGAFPVMRELRTTLDEQAYLCLIAIAFISACNVERG